MDKLRRFDGVVDEVVADRPELPDLPERVAENLALLTAHCGPG